MDWLIKWVSKEEAQVLKVDIIMYLDFPVILYFT